MAVVDDNIGLSLLVGDDPQTSDAVTNDLSKEYWTLQIPMAKQTEAKEWVGNPLGKEDPAYASRYVCKCITHASNNDVLEDGCFAGERRLLVGLEEVSLVGELSGEL